MRQFLIIKNGSCVFVTHLQSDLSIEMSWDHFSTERNPQSGAMTKWKLKKKNCKYGPYDMCVCSLQVHFSFSAFQKKWFTLCLSFHVCLRFAVQETAHMCVCASIPFRMAFFPTLFWFESWFLFNQLCDATLKLIKQCVHRHLSLLYAFVFASMRWQMRIANTKVDFRLPEVHVTAWHVVGSTRPSNKNEMISISPFVPQIELGKHIALTQDSAQPS